MASLVPVTTNRIGSHLPLLQLLPNDAPYSWVRGGEGLVGWGEYASIKVSGKDRFDQVRTWWHQQLETFTVSNAVHGSGTGPVLFTSFSFDRNEESIAVIPRVVIGQKGENSWVTWIGDEPQPVIPDSAPEYSEQHFEWRAGTLTEQQWESRVAQAIAKIDKTEIDKVVLARDLIASTSRDIDVRPILTSLANNYPATWVFSVDGLIGVLELLLNNSGRAE